MRRKRLPFIGLTIVFTVVISGKILYNKRDSLVGTTTPRSERNFIASIRPRKFVTKSMAELGKIDNVNKYFLFLNDVPKSGSEVLILLLQKLQGVNNYKHVRLRDGNKRLLTRTQQEELVDTMYGQLKDQAIPLSFDRHVYFMNFTSFDKQFPTYVNFIRHPVDRILSRGPFFTKGGKTKYFYDCLFRKKNNCNFKTGHSYDLSIPYFCGHDERCMKLNNEWALQEAKSNVEKHYSVVGVLEELNSTLRVLEKEVPYFFKGVQLFFETGLSHIHQQSRKTSSNKQADVPQSVRNLLEETLVTEIQFYEWVKARLLKQSEVQ